MAVSEIKAKFGGSTALTISLASLASSTSGLVARQGTLVDNTTNKFQKVTVYYKIKAGTSPTALKAIYFFLIKFDAAVTPGFATDNAGVSDAGLTIVSAEQVAASGPTTTTTGQFYQGSFVIYNPGPAWTIAPGHDMVAALDSTNSNHTMSYIGENPEAQ